MSVCDDVRERLFLGAARTEDAAHFAACAACRAQAASLDVLARALARDPAPAPPASLAPRVLAAAAPLLGANARRVAWREIGRALIAGLLPLPAILLFDAWALRAIYGALSALLPATLSLYLVVNYAAVLALLCALTYGAIPLLAERQARRRREVLYG